MIGLYGVTAYTVARRTPEIGIRMAVGGERGNIIAMVMRGAVFQIVVRLFVGIPIALLCVRFVRAQLYEITSASPIIVFGAILALTLAAIVAGVIPARRAASIEPAEALRTEWVKCGCRRVWNRDDRSPIPFLRSTCARCDRRRCYLETLKLETFKDEPKTIRGSSLARSALLKRLQISSLRFGQSDLDYLA